MGERVKERGGEIERVMGERGRNREGNEREGEK